jgi:hypothetical protein
MGLKFPKNAISFFIPGDNDDICYSKKEIDMKNYNLKPLYIFLIIFAGAWAIKLLVIQPKELGGKKYEGEFKDTWNESTLEYGDSVVKGKEEIQKEAMSKDSIAIFPGDNLLD